MSEEHEHQEDSDDKSIVDALNTLGWVEEEDEEEIIPSEDNFEEQIAFFREENKRLIGEINQKNEKIHKLELDFQDIIEKNESKTTQNQVVQKLYETIEGKNDEIENLNLLLDQQSKKLNRIINDQIDWAEFRKKFVELGGDGFYGALMPVHKEPIFQNLSDASY